MDYMYLCIYLGWIVCIYTNVEGLPVYIHVSNMDYMYVHIHRWIICICTCM